MKTKSTLLVHLLMYSVSLAFAQPGTLDNTFGTGGIVTTLVGSSKCNGYATAIQADGKIVVAGDYYTGNTYDFAVVRYNTNGTIDNSFGGNGKVGISFGHDDHALALAIQPTDGKIVVAGYAGPDGAIARLTTNGTLDNSFNSSGKLIVDFGGTDKIRSVAIQTDGRIVIAGESLINTFRIAVARINGSDGHFDGGFGLSGTGKVITLVKSSSAGYGVAIQADGKILVTGNYNDGTEYNFFVVRYNTNGTLDNAFGKVGIDFGKDDYGNSIALQQDGKIVVAGSSPNHIAVAKLTTGGKRISNFGIDGKVTTIFGHGCWGYSAAIQSNEKIVVAGFVYDYGAFALVRYNADGSLDNSFGTSGHATTDISTADDIGESVAIQPDGKIVVAGHSQNGSTDVIAMARYNGDPVSLTANAENTAATADKNLSASSTIKIFPNPAKDLLSIDGMDASSTKAISIVDMSGTVLQTITTANGTHTWNIASLPAGTYYLLIDNKKKKISLKFMKE